VNWTVERKNDLSGACLYRHGCQRGTGQIIGTPSYEGSQAKEPRFLISSTQEEERKGRVLRQFVGITQLGRVTLFFRGRNHEMSLP